MKCALSPRGYTCAVPPRHVAAVTARDDFSTTGDKRVLVSYNIIWVGSQKIFRRFLTGDVSPTSTTANKPLPGAHFSYLCVTVTGSVHPCWK